MAARASGCTGGEAGADGTGGGGGSGGTGGDAGGDDHAVVCGGREAGAVVDGDGVFVAVEVSAGGEVVLKKMAAGLWGG